MLFFTAAVLYPQEYAAWSTFLPTNLLARAENLATRSTFEPVNFSTPMRADRRTARHAEKVGAADPSRARELTSPPGRRQS